MRYILILLSFTIAFANLNADPPEGDDGYIILENQGVSNNPGFMISSRDGWSAPGKWIDGATRSWNRLLFHDKFKSFACSGYYTDLKSKPEEFLLGSTEFLIHFYRGSMMDVFYKIGLRNKRYQYVLISPIRLSVSGEPIRFNQVYDSTLGEGKKTPLRFRFSTQTDYKTEGIFHMKLDAICPKNCPKEIKENRPLLVLSGKCAPTKYDPYE